jgi:hypothetical protein
MIELVALSIEASFYIAQAFAVSKLCEGHAAVLVLATETLDVTIAVIALYTTPESMHS